MYSQMRRGEALYEQDNQLEYVVQRTVQTSPVTMPQRMSEERARLCRILLHYMCVSFKALMEFGLENNPRRE